MQNNFKIIALCIGISFLFGFNDKPNRPIPDIQAIKIIGVDFEIMEPAISCDGKVLYFNKRQRNLFPQQSGKYDKIFKIGID